MVACFAAPAFAVTSWSTPSGSSDTVTYSEGQSANGLFGSPTVGDDKFLFFPNNFTAESGAEQSTDTASFLVTAKNGRNINRVSAGLSGDWSILGDGATDAFGTLTLTNPLTSAMITRTFSFTGDFANADGEGTFGDTVITLPLGWKSARVSLAAGLTATAEDGSTSFVQFKNANVGVETVQGAAVPLPGALLAAIPGVAVAYMARKRMRRS
jgi:hypothetical protein